MNKFSSIFGQILQIFDKRDFLQAVHDTKAERCCQGLYLLGPVCCQALLANWARHTHFVRYAGAVLPPVLVS